jgi:nucleoside 2-deoxyribosyltransferase
MSTSIVIYTAAALFNARETFFNSQLVESLEELGYRINFPQRDGFEYGNLRQLLRGKLPNKELSSAVLTVIYYLDMGILIPNSDVILANFDEPLDEGVVVEASFAKFIGKFVIGLRTDVRSPYGDSDDIFGGMHFFPAYQSQVFITHYMDCSTPSESDRQIDILSRKIHETIKEHKITPLKSMVEDYPNIEEILGGANLLFHGIEDMHSPESLKIIAERYLKHKQILDGIRPKILKSI